MVQNSGARPGPAVSERLDVRRREGVWMFVGWAVRTSVHVICVATN